jgi:hypothetical protein
LIIGVVIVCLTTPKPPSMYLISIVIEICLTFRIERQELKISLKLISNIFIGASITTMIWTKYNH